MKKPEIPKSPQMTRADLVKRLHPSDVIIEGKTAFPVTTGAFEQFVRDHKQAHLEVLAASNRLSWTQAELPAKMALEAAEKPRKKDTDEPPEGLQDFLYNLISAAVLRKKYDVAKWARRAQEAKLPDASLQSSLATVASEPHRFIQTVHALRKIDPRVAYFHPSQGFYDYWERKRDEGVWDFLLRFFRSKKSR